MLYELNPRAPSLRVPTSRFENQISRRFAASLPLMLGLLFILLSSAVGQAATLAGRVLDPTGKPVPQAQVTLLKSLAVVDQRKVSTHRERSWPGISANGRGSSRAGGAVD